jgi:hypothetical protein
VVVVPTCTGDEKRALEVIRQYVQKKGKAANYHPTPEEEVIVTHFGCFSRLACGVSVSLTAEDAAG